MHHIQSSDLFYISIWENDGDGRHCACWAWIKSLQLDNVATLTGFPGIRATMPHYGAAPAGMGMNFEHRQHKGLSDRAENSHLPTRRRETIMKRFKSARHLQCFVSIHDPIANLHNFPRHAISSSDYRALRSEAMIAWREIAELGVAA